MNCTICGKPIVLVPSAKERAAKYGGTPADYTNRFTEHADCIIKKRETDTLDLIRRINPPVKLSSYGRKCFNDWRNP